MKLRGIGKIGSYDLKVFSRMFLDAFSNKSDKVLLLLILPFAIAFFQQGLDEIRKAISSFGQTGLSALAIILALSSIFTTKSRIAWHGENGILAPIALRKEALIIYGLLSMILCFSASLMITGLSTSAIVALLIGLLAAMIEIAFIGFVFAKLAKPLGVLLSRFQIVRKIGLDGGRRTRVWNTISSITLVPTLGFAGNMLLLAVVSLFLGLGFDFLVLIRVDRVLAIFAVVSVIILIMLSILLRLPHSIPPFLATIGISPFNTSAVITSFGMALLGPCAFVLAVSTDTRHKEVVALGFALAIAVVGFVALIQAAHYALRGRQAANTAIQFEVAVLALIAGMLAPAAPILALIRIAFLRKAVERRRLLLP